MDIDFLDLELPIDDSSKPIVPLKRSVFQPNASKLGRKPKQEGKPPIPTKEEPMLLSTSATSIHLSGQEPGTSHSLNMLETKKDDEEAPDEKPMVTDSNEEDSSITMDADQGPEEDHILREIDVYFKPSPLEDNAELYVMQYPLRPCWRPYDNFEQVRIKPKQSKLEVDLSLNHGYENHDMEARERLKLEKETLTSSKAFLSTGYAIGILKGNELHLHPIRAVSQFRRSLNHLKKVARKRNTINQSMEASAHVAKGKSANETSVQNADNEEPWIPLKYYDAESAVSSRYREKMMAGEGSAIPFSMGLKEYIDSLCPGTSFSNRDIASLIRSLLSLPLNERFRRWFSEGPEVHRFATLKHLAPCNSDKEVLDVLKQYADLVQGLWVAKSKLRCKGMGLQALARDYVLLLFTKNRSAKIQKLKCGFSNNILETVLVPLAVKRELFDDWRFQEADEIFQKEHPDIVKEQERDWSIKEKQIMEALNKVGRATSVRCPPKPKIPNGIASHTGQNLNVKPANTPVTLSSETREALPKALVHILSTHKACSLELICKGLRAMGHPESASSEFALAKTNPEIAKAASFGAFAPASELQSFLEKIAENIHGIYVLKPQGSSDFDGLRRILISLFRGKEANARLKKADIVEAARLLLRREITNQEYNKVVSEYCVSDKGSWMLKGSVIH